VTVAVGVAVEVAVGVAVALTVAVGVAVALTVAVGVAVEVAVAVAVALTVAVGVALPLAVDVGVGLIGVGENGVSVGVGRTFFSTHFGHGSHPGDITAAKAKLAIRLRTAYRANMRGTPGRLTSSCYLCGQRPDDLRGRYRKALRKSKSG